MEHKLCVLIDFENIAAGTEKEGLGQFDIRAVVRRLKDKGRILVNRSYGDWGRFARFKQRLLEQGVTMVELTSYRGQEKNRADIALVVDAMEIAFTRDYIDTFVLMSGDSDFTPLVMRLKELDRRVIGIGTRGSSSRLLVDSCDEFIFYESLLKQAYRDEAPVHAEPPRYYEAPPAEHHHDDQPHPASNPTDDTAGLTREEAFELLVETLNGIQKDDPGPVLGGLIKQSMLRKEPSFDETEHGYAGFARFLEAARSRGIVTLTRDQKAGGYRVDLKPSEAAAEAPIDNTPEETAKPIEVTLPEAPLEANEAAMPTTAELPRFHGQARRMHEALLDAGVVLVSHMARHTVIHELVDHVSERERRRKRNTLQYVYGDIARRCRKTDPFVAQDQVKAAIDTIKAAGILKHSSGGPVRSPNAHFVIRTDPDEIVIRLRRFYISVLLDRGVAVADTMALSELIWNDRSHALEAGELVAWIQHDRALEAEERANASEVPSAWDEAPVEE